MPIAKLESFSLAELQAEVKRRSELSAAFKQKKAQLVARVAQIDREMAALEGAAAPAPAPAKPVAPAPAKPAAPAKAAKPGRAARTGTLADAMAKVMSKTQRMRADQIIGAVTKAGYKSKSKTFRTIVYQTLARDKRFRRAGRGLYVVR